MKRTLRFLGWTMLASLVFGIALLVGVVSMATSMDPMTVRIGGGTLSLDALDAGQSLLAIGGVALTLVIVVLVVPLAVLIPLALVAVALVGALLVLAGVLAMVCSPLVFAVLVVWLMVRLIRRDARKAPGRVDGGATIAR